MLVDPARDRLLVFGGREGTVDPEPIPLSSLTFETPRPPSIVGPILWMEGMFGAISCIGFANDGAGWLGTFNGLCGIFALGSAVLSPQQGLTIESQVAMGAAWIGLSALQFDQDDRGAPRSQAVIGNLIGYHALMLTGGAVDWVAKRLHHKPKVGSR